MEEENRFEEAEKRYKQEHNYTKIILGFLALIASAYYAYISFYEPTYLSKKLPKTKVVPKAVVQNTTAKQQNTSSQQPKQKETKQELECPAPLPEISISLNNSFEKKLCLLILIKKNLIGQLKINQ